MNQGHLGIENYGIVYAIKLRQQKPVTSCGVKIIIDKVQPASFGRLLLSFALQTRDGSYLLHHSFFPALLHA